MVWAKRHPQLQNSKFLGIHPSKAKFLVQLSKIMCLYVKLYFLTILVSHFLLNVTMKNYNTVFKGLPNKREEK